MIVAPIGPGAAPGAVPSALPSALPSAPSSTVTPGSAGLASANPTMGEAFGSLAANAVETLRAAETAGAGAITGEVGMREAVDRVMEAERTLRASVAIRDKLVAGWLDVSRMAI